MNKVLVFLSALLVASEASVIKNYANDGYDSAGEAPTSADPYAVQDEMGSESGYGGESGYGESYATKCYPTYDIQYEDKCQDYTDRVCTTHHSESCHDGVVGENCQAIVTSKQVRKCFNVTELLCSLKEDVQYEVIQATFTVQKCQKVTERVCDTVYDTSFTAKDDYKCMILPSVHCYPEDSQIQDKTCKTITKFECYEVAQDSYSSSDSYGSSEDAYGSSGYDNGYGSRYPKPPSVPKTVCKKHVDTKCYNTPRTVTSEKCDVRKEKKCQKLPERVPFPVEKQHCHNEEKKVCELEQRQQPKQVKKYVYSKHCRPISRNICENADVKDLVQSCAPHATKTCRYTPKEKCVDVPKEHCYKVAKLVQKQKCEQVKTGYEKPVY